MLKAMKISAITIVILFSLTFSASCGSVSTTTPTTTTLPTLSPTPTPSPTPLYSLTILPCVGGTTIPATGTWPSRPVGIIATADPDYQFIGWTGDTGTIANVSAASTTIILNGNYSIKANFALLTTQTYTLTLNSTLGGKITNPGEGSYTYNSGQVVHIVTTAAEPCFQFDGWRFSAGFLPSPRCGFTIANSKSTDTTITMNQNYSISAGYHWDPPVITSLVANPSVVSLGNETIITCNAFDNCPNLILSYDWGQPNPQLYKISGFGNTIHVIPSTTGEFYITVWVKDGIGLATHKSIPVWCK